MHLIPMCITLSLAGASLWISACSLTGSEYELDLELSNKKNCDQIKTIGNHDHKPKELNTIRNDIYSRSVVGYVASQGKTNIGEGQAACSAIGSRKQTKTKLTVH